MIRASILLSVLVGAGLSAAPGVAQQVCLPMPRLLTVTPMGGRAGTSVEVRVTHQHVDEVLELMFSTPHITAQPVVAADGAPVPNRFLVTIASDTPVGMHEARVRSRLGVSAPRAFAVGDLPEIVVSAANRTVETALHVPGSAVCNAMTTPQAIDHYSFKAVKGRRVVVACDAVEIDSKLNPVVMIADATGRDLLSSRDGGVLVFTPPDDDTYLIKVHSLAYQGGDEQFYRLAVREASGEASPPREAGSRRVSSFSWPPEGLSATALTSEMEPNDGPAVTQKITLPCDISGNFSPGNDVDVFEFQANKGEEWWVEVASERIGMQTDPFVLVQRVVAQDGTDTPTDVAELDDIAHPVKPGTFVPASTYTGPPYAAGSPDVLGKLTIGDDGTYRLRLRDLLGGPGGVSGSVYRLLVRKAAPDFAVVAWPAHVQMRQNDFGTFSKPIALRAGATMALEVAAVRRDGFDGAIELSMEGLPPGVRAAGMTIPPGKQMGMIFITADETATPAWSIAQIFGSGRIADVEVRRRCPLASMVWTIDYAPNDFPRSRLTADVPVSVTDFERATASIAALTPQVWEAEAGQTLTIPLRITWRESFNGDAIKLKPFGTVFSGLKPIDLPVQAATIEAVVDLAALKTPPGDHLLAFNGISVVKHQSNAAVATVAEERRKRAGEAAAAAIATAKELAQKAQEAPEPQRAEANEAVTQAVARQRTAEAELADAERHLKTMTAAVAPQDILDFLVSEPIRVRVNPAAAGPKP